MSDVEVLEANVIPTEEQRKAILKEHKRKKLTPKDIKFIKEYVTNGGNKTQAALSACDVTTYGAAKASGQYMANKLENEIQTAMTKFGLTEETAMTRHKELIESSNENVAAKMVDTWYKYHYKDKDSQKDSVVNVQINF
jgi:phage terminase small subunit